MQYAQVIIDITHEKVDRPFQYRIPERLEDKLSEGSAVVVPFGLGNREKLAYVMSISDKPCLEPEKIKDILGLAKDQVAVEKDLILLALWMKKTYGGTLIGALKTVLPAKEKVGALKHRTVYAKLEEDALKSTLAECVRKHQKAKVRAIEALIENDVIPYEFLTQKLSISSQTLMALERDDVIGIDEKRVFRNPVREKKTEHKEYELSDKQKAAVDKVISDYDNGNSRTYLLYGMTGSGKTEVYLNAVENMLKRGKQCIVLIPEISLTYQTLMRFYQRFGDKVSIVNSTLSKGEKYDQFERAKKGEISVMIGPRSALFTPFENLGLIIIDEEHENSYKSEKQPRYHAREAAIYLAKLKNASVLLGSATPAIESFNRAKTGEYELLRLGNRLTGGALPEVDVVDLREELKSGNKSIFSIRLQELIKDRLEKKEQTMLFINRRGYSGFVSCRSCGEVIKCPHCDVSLSEHRGGFLQCHYCGYTTNTVKKCPHCGSPFIAGFKAGTEQIEEKLKSLFPEAKVLRMDKDTTKKKDGYENILSAFGNGEADILLGTQMIVKGHDFPNVTLMGVLAADMSLHAGDYRAGEVTFELLTQAAGRAGRGQKAGNVVIQTYDPDNYSIVCAAAQDYERFYEEEMLYREMLLYPPAAHIGAVLINGKDEEAVKKLANELHGIPVDKSVTLLPVVPYTVSKVMDVYRYLFYGKSKDLNAICKWKNQVEEYVQNSLTDSKTEGLAVQFDLDPMRSY